MSLYRLSVCWGMDKISHSDALTARFDRLVSNVASHEEVSFGVVEFSITAFHWKYQCHVLFFLDVLEISFIFLG